ncbi:hypothetical protein [Streptomyces hydrogenans]|uniref:hypothetical protein n=1 Tax=Streptomyces hydrogenans TaxID=1873719 RepID=UPI0036E9130C
MAADAPYPASLSETTPTPADHPHPVAPRAPPTTPTPADRPTPSTLSDRPAPTTPS